LKYFEEEYNPIILEKMMKDNFTRDAIHTLKLKVTKIDKLAKRAFYMPFFNKIAKRARLERRKSFLVDSQLAYRFYLKIKDGEQLEKFHYSSNGSRKEFFKIVDSKYLRWAPDAKKVNNPKANCHSFDLAQIRGLTYGKVTSTFQKKKNEKLFSWLCVSMIMGKRPYDIYCSEDNVNAWYIGLAYAVKKHNPNAYVLSVGRFFWRKLRFLMTYLVIDRMSEDQKKKYTRRGLSFCKAILLYRRIKFNAAV
jgi:hypothetical protein